MKRLFAKRRTVSGRKAIEDLGETVKVRWMPALIHLLSGENEQSLLLAQNYLDQSVETHGGHSKEIACGLFLLSLNYRVLGRSEELGATERRYDSIKNQIRDAPTPVTMLQALHDLAVSYQRQDDPESTQRAFLSALVALSLLVSVHKSFPQTDLMELFYRLFHSLGFPGNRWEWLLRRCDFIRTDFVGLVSVLIDEGLFPSETKKLEDVSKANLDEGEVIQQYEVVKMIADHSKSLDGFSKAFPASVAKGELSMRVEELLAEGCQCLSATGDLSIVVLVFSTSFIGKRITVLGTDTRSDEGFVAVEETMRRVIAEYGADSAMLLMLLDAKTETHDESQESSRDAYVDSEVAVEARDSKSYLVGTQTARWIDGKYVFETPTVLDTERGLFDELTFPIQPEKKK
jgi:hypothetical protein